MNKSVSSNACFYPSALPLVLFRVAANSIVASYAEDAPKEEHDHTWFDNVSGNPEGQLVTPVNWAAKPRGIGFPLTKPIRTWK
jgi:hypothetical protein